MSAAPGPPTPPTPPTRPASLTPPTAATGLITAGKLVLALDAGSPVVSVAIGRIGAEVPPLAVRARAVEHSSRQLLVFIGEVLAEAGARPADLGGVVALRGPGGFTGLRIGLATALGLQQALGVPALGLPTLGVLAAASGAPPGAMVIAAVDALRGEWSAQAFRVARPPAIDPRPLSEPLLMAGGDLLRLLPEADPPPPVARPAKCGPAEATEPTRRLPRTAIVVAHGVEGLAASWRSAAAAATAAGAAWRLSFREPEPLAAAALRLAGAAPFGAWGAAGLAAPLYARPPATTMPRGSAAGGRGV